MGSDIPKDTHKKSRLILLAEGSPDPRWQRPFLALLEKLDREFGPDRIVLAYLQTITPSLLEIAEAAQRDRVSDLVILPLFLALGDELEQAIPRQVVAVKERYPGLGIILLPPVGEHPAVTDAIYSVASSAAQ